MRDSALVRTKVGATSSWDWRAGLRVGWRERKYWGWVTEAGQGWGAGASGRGLECPAGAVGACLSEGRMLMVCSHAVGELGPVLFGGVGGMDAEAVAAGGVVVELGGDVGVHEGAVVDESVLAVALIVLGLDEEGGRGELVGRVGGEELGFVGRSGEVGGVDDDGEVWRGR